MYDTELDVVARIMEIAEQTETLDEVVIKAANEFGIDALLLLGILQEVEDAGISELTE